MHELLDELFGPAPSGLGGDNACSCSGSTSERFVTERVKLNEDDFFEVEVPILRCDECGFEFRDHRAEALRHAAACRHEGLLAPNEVKAIREWLGMTRKVFGEAFGIPPASMERWENGKLMQNRSMDTLLRSLQIPGVAAALDRRQVEDFAAKGNVIYVNFGALSLRPVSEQEDALRRSRTFNLQAIG
ncbi:hypothetical protein [Erythrobacter sp.]|uniref:hypothetical protein n=1 Tax=Erythrobacter sp. TaxID=1042 RepID=UPI0025CDA61F|nr:hypothetical protein [Erythrobacter sp.]